MRLDRLAPLALLLFLVAGCTPPAEGARARELVVFAAASLGQTFDEVGAAFAARYPDLAITSSYAGSSQLRLQLQHGAQADLFASANERQMAQVRQDSVVSDPRVFAHNHLVVIVPRNNPAALHGLHDLARPGLKIVAAHPDVPAGAYAHELLSRLAGDPSYGPAYQQAVLANIVSEEDNVRQVVAKVRLGQADAGFVYRTDVTPGAVDELSVIDVPRRYNPLAAYLIAPTAAAQQPELAERFVQFLLSPEGQAILERHGFLPA